MPKKWDKIKENYNDNYSNIMTPKNKVLLDDQSRFIRTIRILSEFFINDFVGRWLHNGYYPTDFNEILCIYDDYSKELLSEFSNPNINIVYKVFNKSFYILKKFLTAHFAIPKQDYVRYDYPPFYYLEPEIHHNFGKQDATSSLRWDEYKKELDNLADKVEKNYKNFIKIAKRELEKQISDNQQIMPLSKTIESNKIPKLYLNNVGDLWREPKTKYCYPLGENSDRHKIVRYLITHKEYQQTSTISEVLGQKSEQSIRTEIGKIRKNIKKFLNIDGKQIIEEGRKGSGYKIGSKYEIKLKKK